MCFNLAYLLKLWWGLKKYGGIFTLRGCPCFAVVLGVWIGGGVKKTHF